MSTNEAQTTRRPGNRGPIPWNKGKLVGQKPPLKMKEVWRVRFYLQQKPQPRDLALFDLAIDSKLRGCDLVQLNVDDVAVGGRARSRAVVRQRKTGHPVQFEITEQTREAVAAWMQQGNRKSGDYLFPNRRNSVKPMTTRQYARLVRQWLDAVGMDGNIYGTHSLRRTKPTLIYRRTGNLRAVQLLLGHTKLESTVRYLGVEVDDALEISEHIDL
jgi:integrase